MAAAAAKRTPSSLLAPPNQDQPYMKQTFSGWRKGSTTAMVKRGEYRAKNPETGKFEQIGDG